MNESDLSVGAARGPAPHQVRCPRFRLGQLLIHNASLSSEGEPLLFHVSRRIFIETGEGECQINYDGRVVGPNGVPTPQTATFMEQELSPVPAEVLLGIRKSRGQQIVTGPYGHLGGRPGRG